MILLFSPSAPLSVEDRDELQAWYECAPALPPLSRAEEAEATPDQLVAHNMRLVVPIACKYAGRGVALVDLLQEGCIGLVNASRSFDAAKGYKFSTYAGRPIAQHIIRALHNQGNAIRIPVHIHEGRTDNSAAVLAAADQARGVTSLDQPAGGSNVDGMHKQAIVDFIPAENDTAAEVERNEERAEARALAARALAALDCLEAGERASFVARYIDGLSVPAAAAMLGYSPASVRQMSYMARAKLRAALQHERISHAS